MKPHMVMISKKITIGVLLFLLLSGIYQLTAVLRVQSIEQPKIVVPGLTGKTVIIDPGHGGADPGAVVGNTREAELNMQLADVLKTKLELVGVRVLLTRSGNQGLVPQELMSNAEQGFILQQRKEFAALQGGQLFISIHVNSNKDKRVSGGIVYYTDISSLPLADAIQQQLNQFSGKSWQPVKKDFSITRGNTMPTVLVETAFITNSHDREILISKPESLVQEIFEGIQDYAQKFMAMEIGSNQS